MTQPLDGALDGALAAFASRRPVLVALDFDGVLAPFVPHPSEAVPLPGTVEAASAMAALAGVTVAMVSGRARDDLADRAGLATDGPVLLVGSHGAELPDPDGALDGTLDGGLDGAARERLAAVQAALEGVVAQYPGAFVEHKPSAAVLHTRTVARQDADRATAAALAAVASVQGTHVTRGKEVVEVAVTEASKGAAITHLRERLGAASVLYVGDDVTDETVFVVLGDSDVGIKVGVGDTAARYRLPDPPAVRTLLDQLLAALARR